MISSIQDLSTIQAAYEEKMGKFGNVGGLGGLL